MTVETLDRLVKIAVGFFLLYWIGWKYESWWAAIGFIPILKGLFPQYGCYDFFGRGYCQISHTNEKKY